MLILYPAKCDRTFGGTLLFIVGRTEVQQIFGIYKDLTEKINLFIFLAGNRCFRGSSPARPALLPASGVVIVIIRKIL